MLKKKKYWKLYRCGFKLVNFRSEAQKNIFDQNNEYNIKQFEYVYFINDNKFNLYAYALSV